MNTLNNIFIPICSQINEKIKNSHVILSIEGGSASGKSTLSKILSEVYSCNVIHMDDFFLRPEQRTKERLAEIGGNIDKERFYDEVVVPLSEFKPIYYRKYDCSTATISLADVILPKKICIVEGAYSMHPYFKKYYNLSVFLDISPDYQKERISKRNTPENAKKFESIWIPMENAYFDAYKIKEKCDVIISVDKLKENNTDKLRSQQG